MYFYQLELLSSALSTLTKGVKVGVHQVTVSSGVLAPLLAVLACLLLTQIVIFCAIVIENVLPFELHFKKQTSKQEKQSTVGVLGNQHKSLLSLS